MIDIVKQVKLPSNISFHTPDNVSSPFSQSIARRLADSQYKGIVSKDGGFIGQPIQDWRATIVEPGHYRIIHNTGFESYSVSHTALSKGTTSNLLSMDPYNIDILITDSEGQPTSGDFAICVSRTAYLAGEG